MRTLRLAVALLLAPPLLAQSPRRDGGTLAPSHSTESPTAPVRQPYSPPQEPRPSKTTQVIVQGSALVAGIAAVILSNPDEGEAQPIHPIIRVPFAFLAGAFVGAVISSQILRLFGD